jgi:hypothetical protein
MAREDIILARLKTVEDITDAAAKRIQATMDKLERLVIERVTEADVVGKIDAALALSEAQRMLVDSGYYVEVGQLLNADYQRVIEEAFAGYQEMLDKSLQFSAESLSKLDALKQIDFREFNRIGQKTAEELSRGIVDLQFGAVTRKQMFEQLERQIKTNKGYITTWADTGLSGYYRQSNILLAEDAGMDRFKYLGALDSLTRPFCRKHLKEVRTVDGWNSLNAEQGQIAPVSIYGGGFRCRHVLVATEDKLRVNE